MTGASTESIVDYSCEIPVRDPVDVLVVGGGRPGWRPPSPPSAQGRTRCWSSGTVISKKIRRYRLIIIDEVGYIPVDQDATNLFFQLIASRYEQGSVMATSNLPLRALGRDLLRRRRRRSHDRPVGAPRRGPHSHRRLLPHPPTQQHAGQRPAEPS
jgi:hypothetical protein